ncbi:MAG: hypothetical protein HY238_05480 [Acidobacteria bacterium]|nr:hypothetical protein [Acidobacteriota bacterium]
MKPAKGVVLLLLFVFCGASVYAQTGMVAVNLQGAMFDRSEPPGPAVPVVESIPIGAKVIISPTSDAGFNLALFTDNPNSTLFKAFRYPGKAVDANGVRIPANAYVFYGTVQDGNFAGDLLVFSGEISADGPRGPQGLLYTGSSDNPIITPPDSAPVLSWDVIYDGIAGNGDNLACQEAVGPLPTPGFIAVIERGSCLFFVKAQNAAKAGAIAAIIYNHEQGGDNFILNMATPGADIPSVFLRRSDGLDLLKYANDNRAAPAQIVLTPKNLLGTINGSFKTKEGVLDSVNLNLVIGDQDDSIFAGTVNR